MNYIINWITDATENRNIVNGRFDFYGRVAGITNLVKRVPDNKNNKKSLVKTKKNLSKSPKPSKQVTSSTDFNRNPL